MTLREKQTKFAGMLGLLLRKAGELGTPVLILELYRSLETQKGYVARGVSKTLNSKHLDGLAVDIAFIEDIRDDGKLNYSPEKYKPLGEYWEALDSKNVWGGRFGESSPGMGNGWDSGHLQAGD